MICYWLNFVFDIWITLDDASVLRNAANHGKQKQNRDRYMQRHNAYVHFRIIFWLRLDIENGTFVHCYERWTNGEWSRRNQIHTRANEIMYFNIFLTFNEKCHFPFLCVYKTKLWIPILDISSAQSFIRSSTSQHTVCACIESTVLHLSTHSAVCSTFSHALNFHECQACSSQRSSHARPNLSRPEDPHFRCARVHTSTPTTRRTYTHSHRRWCVWFFLSAAHHSTPRGIWMNGKICSSSLRVQVEWWMGPRTGRFTHRHPDRRASDKWFERKKSW